MNRVLFEVFFWTSVMLVIYTYAGYPVLIAFLARVTPRRLRFVDAPLPPVTLIISAYNESQVIGTKLKNSLELDYPRNMLEIIVVSDCSDDGTDEIVARFAPDGVRLLRQQNRQGKSTGLNLAVSLATGSILVFSDANALYRRDAIRQLVRHFSDPCVGYTVGNARYLEPNSKTPSAESEGLYWKHETWLKKKESEFYAVVGGDGAIYAIRRDLFFPLLPTDISDFLNPLQIIDKGFVGVFEPAAVSYEDAAESFGQEFHRKVRIVSRSLNAVRRIPGVLNPLRVPRHWFLLVSHKLLRWFAPFFLIAMFVFTLPLWDLTFYRIAALLQLAFYVVTLVGWRLQRRRALPRLIYIPYYFFLVNLAAFIGVIKCFRGALSPTWRTARQGQGAS